MIRVKLKRVLWDISKTSKDDGSGSMLLEYECLDSLSENPEAKDIDGNDLKGKIFAASGFYLPTAKMFEYNIYGVWEKGSKGPIFKVYYNQIAVELTQSGIITYLSSDFFPGVGISLASKIYLKFKEDTIKIIDTEPQRLLEVKGVSENIVAVIKENHSDNASAKDTIIFFNEYGLSSKKSMAIFEKFGTASIDKVKEDPYSLYGLHGFDFNTVDALGYKFGILKNDYHRIRVAALDALKQQEGSVYGNSNLPNIGSSVMSQMNLVTTINKLLSGSVSFDDIKKVLRSMMLNKDLFVTKTQDSQGNPVVWVSRARAYYAEQFIANYVVNKIGKVEHNFNIDELIDSYELRAGFKLDITQRTAINNGLNNRLSVITGGPGTGKTTIVEFIINIFKDINPNGKILLAAPSGAASRKMKSQKDAQASTIHGAFGFKPGDDGEPIPDNNDPVEADLVIIDETSMVDMYLMEAVFKKIKPEAQIIVLGDIDQLPSVQAGAILRDFIDSKIIPVAILRLTHRQEQGNLIPINAELIKKGKTNLREGKDFQIIESTSYEEGMKLIQNEFSKYMKNIPIKDQTILTPLKKNGVDILNPHLQEEYNPLREGMQEVTSRKFRVGDKVINTVNKASIGIYNGDIGIVTEVHPEPDAEIKAVVQFNDDLFIAFQAQDLKDLELAYSMTIHKSQGSEFDVVIIHIDKRHSMMLYRKLLYTAITRGKRRVIIVGDRKAIDLAIQTDETQEQKRNTLIVSKINEVLKKRGK